MRGPPAIPAFSPTTYTDLLTIYFAKTRCDIRTLYPLLMSRLSRSLLSSLNIFAVDSVAGTIAAIKDMAVRGAPAIGAAGAFGLVLAANASVAVTP